MREADLYFEIIDPNSGKTLSDGKTGEIVLTALTLWRIPLIRYRTGDVCRFVPHPCSCGTVLKRMEPVRSRISGKIELFEDQWITMADLDEAIFAENGIVDFSARLSRRNQSDCIQIDASTTEDKETEAILCTYHVLLGIQGLQHAVQLKKLTISIKIKKATVQSPLCRQKGN